MEIRLAKSTIRPWRRGDELSLVRHANDREVWLNLRDSFPHPYKMMDARRWVVRMSAAREPESHALEVDGHAVGSIGLVRGSDVYRLSAEIGFWLAREYWGRGIMTEAVGAFTRYGFSQMGLLRIFAHVFEWNAASMRVLEKNGYVREGVLRKSAFKAGRAIDQVLYAAVI
jgi:RimJ/RimL family protein N-acetyltransferase